MQRKCRACYQKILGWSSKESFRFKNRIRAKYCDTHIFSLGFRFVMQSGVVYSRAVHLNFHTLHLIHRFSSFSFSHVFLYFSRLVDRRVVKGGTFFFPFHFIFPYSDNYERYSILYNLVTSRGAVETCKYVATRFLQVKLRLH